MTTQRSSRKPRNGGLAKRAVIVVANDFQCGNELAICDPNTTIYKKDGKRFVLVPVDANPVQQYLFGIYDWGVKGALDFAGNDDIYFFVNGDYTDGNHFAEGKMAMSHNNQVRMAFDVINHLAKHKQVKTIRLTSSTGVHAFAENSADTAIVDRLTEKYPDKDIRLIEHGLISIDGVYIDMAHHSPGDGTRRWLKGNNFLLYVKDIVHASHDDGLPVPHLVFRAHRHVKVRVCHTAQFGDLDTTTWGFIVPAFQLLTPYARKITQSTPQVVNGLLAVEIIDGEVGRQKWFTKIKQVRMSEEL